MSTPTPPTPPAAPSPHTVLELAAYETFAALAAVIPPAPATLLEVGCGQGVLAALLEAAGYRVTALEPDEKAAAAARERGVRVLAERFADHRGGPYDVVFFGRSLHHISPLPETVSRALGLLSGDGVLVVEEFRREAVGVRGAGFLYDSAALLEAAGLPVKDRDTPEVADPLERWEAMMAEVERDHPMHTSMRVVAEVRRLADVVFEREVPYLWRRVLGGSAETVADPRVAAAAEVLHRVERRRIAEGSLPALGLLVAARPRTQPPSQPPSQPRSGGSDG